MLALGVDRVQRMVAVTSVTAVLATAIAVVEAMVPGRVLLGTLGVDVGFTLEVGTALGVELGVSVGVGFVVAVGVGVGLLTVVREQVAFGAGRWEPVPPPVGTTPTGARLAGCDDFRWLLTDGLGVVLAGAPLGNRLSTRVSRNWARP